MLLCALVTYIASDLADACAYGFHGLRVHSYNPKRYKLTFLSVWLLIGEQQPSRATGLIFLSMGAVTFYVTLHKRKLRDGVCSLLFHLLF